jgi:hypothetical protein
MRPTVAGGVLVALLAASSIACAKDVKFTHVRAYFDPTQFPQPGSG